MVSFERPESNKQADTFKPPKVYICGRYRILSEVCILRPTTAYSYDPGALSFISSKLSLDLKVYKKWSELGPELKYRRFCLGELTLTTTFCYFFVFCFCFFSSNKCNPTSKV